MTTQTSWNAELYEAQHSFVWQLGADLIETLAPKPGEHILDVGCGTGQLTYQISQKGAQVLGIDSSPEMIGQARQNYPQLSLRLLDAVSMPFSEEFDAVFSNAVLHWVLDADGAASSMSRALRKGGRLVLEMGGRGNVRQIHQAVENAHSRHANCPLPAKRNYFPSVSDYSGVLEAHEFEVRSALLFDRPTLLEGEQGMERWILQFCAFYLHGLTARVRRNIIDGAVEELRPWLWRDGRWFADYRRLRISAIKL